MIDRKQIPPEGQATKGSRSRFFRVMRRILIGLVGGAVFIAGVVMILLPGPGMLVMLIGIGILATEFLIARRWLIWLRRKARRVGIRFPRRRKR